MSPSEFAFLALGLFLGGAAGAALVVVFRSRPATREVRVTVEHAAVPRRPSTLSADAFSGAPGEVARGGPADRRAHDRDYPATGDPPPPRTAPGGLPWPAGPVAPPAWVRTNVQYGPAPRPTAQAGGPAIGIPVVAEPAVELETLRAQVAVAAERAARSGHLTAAALLERRAAVATAVAPTAAPPVTPPAPPLTSVEPDPPPAGSPPIVGLVRGHHPTLVTATRELAGDDPIERRRWGALLVILADGLRDAAIRAGALEFPAGHQFWSLFSEEQRREIAAALASTGHRFDGRSGWADDRVPLHRDLTIAVADAGLEPERIRHWPDADATRALYRGAKVMADAFLFERAPELEQDAVRAVLGTRARALDELWAAWDRVRLVLLGLPAHGASAG